jgi:hypothetical protein
MMLLSRPSPIPLLHQLFEEARQRVERLAANSRLEGRQYAPDCTRDNMYTLNSTEE